MGPPSQPRSLGPSPEAEAGDAVRDDMIKDVTASTTISWLQRRLEESGAALSAGESRERELQDQAAAAEARAHAKYEVEEARGDAEEARRAARKARADAKRAWAAKAGMQQELAAAKAETAGRTAELATAREEAQRSQDAAAERAGALGAALARERELMELMRQSGWTRLHVAAARGDLDETRLLLDAGTDKEAKMKGGATPLHLAAQHGRLGAVRALLAAGADKGAAREDGWTPLHVAAAADRVEILQELLRSGASKEARSKDQKRPFDLAREPLARALLKADNADKADPDPLISAIIGLMLLFGALLWAVLKHGK